LLGGLFGLSPVLVAVGLMLAFKVGSTLDSMVGYKDERFLEMGWAGARLDDLMNCMPARLSLAVLFFGASLSGLYPLDGMKVAIRDRLRHESPNAGHPESFAAGALRVRLGGLTMYAEGLKEKPWLGEGYPDPSPLHVRRACLLVQCSAWISMAAVLSLILLVS
jgi:adenosylcobinamide-phosphate synthase